MKLYKRQGVSFVGSGGTSDWGRLLFYFVEAMLLSRFS